MNGLKQWLTGFVADHLSGFSVSDLPNYLFTLFLAAFWAWLLQRLFLAGNEKEKEDQQVARQLIVITVAITIAVTVVRYSIPLAIVLAGVLALIRFKVHARNSRELTFVLIAIVIGLGHGAGHAVVTTLGLMVLFPLLWMFNRKKA